MTLAEAAAKRIGCEVDEFQEIGGELGRSNFNFTIGTDTNVRTIIYILAELPTSALNLKYFETGKNDYLWWTLENLQNKTPFDDKTFPEKIKEARKRVKWNH